MLRVCRLLFLLCCNTNGAREEYIEAELAKRHSMVYGGLQQAHQSSSSSQSGRGGKGKGPKETAAAGDKSADKHTALTGKLFEVDLGDEIRNRNALMTDRAMRKLQGLVVEDEEQSERPKKVRLGRDGKPWRPKNQRDNDAIKRDQIVEEILRENKRKLISALLLLYSHNQIKFHPNYPNTRDLQLTHHLLY